MTLQIIKKKHFLKNEQKEKKEKKNPERHYRQYTPSNLSTPSRPLHHLSPPKIFSCPIIFSIFKKYLCWSKSTEFQLCKMSRIWCPLTARGLHFAGSHGTLQTLLKGSVLCSYWQRDLSVSIAHSGNKQEISYKTKEGKRKSTKGVWGPPSLRACAQSVSCELQLANCSRDRAILQVEAPRKRVSHWCGSLRGREGCGTDRRLLGWAEAERPPPCPSTPSTEKQL